MANIIEICPHCGNTVEGKKVKSYTNKVTRQGVKSAVHMVTGMGGMATGATVGSVILPGVGTVVGGALGFIGSAMFNQKVNESIDKVGDKVEDELMLMDYEFTCPKCGHSWMHNEAETYDDNDIDDDDDGLSASKIKEIHEVLNIIADELNVDVDDISPNSDLEDDLGASNLKKMNILSTLEEWAGTDSSKKYSDFTFVDDFIEEFTGETLWGEDVPALKDDDDNSITEYDINSYMSLRSIISMRYYCHYMIYSQSDGDIDYQIVASKISNDIGYEIYDYQFQADCREDAFEKLVGTLVYDADIVNWHNLILHIPHGKSSDDFLMDNWYSCGLKDNGHVLIGVITSGTIHVGDTVVLYTEEGESYKATVTWIEMFGKTSFDNSAAGNDVGLGVDIDLNTILGTINYVAKYGETQKQEDKHVIEEFSTEEQEYLNELKEILADGEISPRERRLLVKIRTQLGISEERAAELEASLSSPSLTPEEQEYHDEFKEIIAEGQISPRDQRFLEKLKKANGISDERAKEIENLVK